MEKEKLLYQPVNIVPFLKSSAMKCNITHYVLYVINCL
jgi:hypothetical protein